jgi:competence protein ComFC
VRSEVRALYRPHHTLHVTFSIYNIFVFARLFNFILTLIFPPYCASCQRLGTFLCGNCYDELEFRSIPVQLKLTEQHIASIIVSVAYSGPAPKLLYLMKYKSVKDVAVFFGQFLYDTTFFPEVEVITSVPIHKKRQQERGFNQSEVMAKEFAKLAKIPYLPLLLKLKHTPPQAKTKTKNHRLHNLDQAFTINPQVKHLKRLPQSVLILDDVCTTGTTLNQCAAVLKKLGVQDVYGLVVAHGK